MKETPPYQLFDAIIRSIADPLIALNEKFEYVYINDHAKQLLNVSDEVLNRSIWEVFPNLSGTWFKAGCEEVMEKKMPVQLEEYFEEFDHWAEITIYPLSGGITILFRGITERKNRELEDLKLIRRNSMILQSMGDMYLLVDKQLNIRDVNKATTQVLKCSKEKLLSMNLQQIDCKFDKEQLPYIISNNTVPTTPFLDTCFKDMKQREHAVELVIFKIHIEGEEHYGLIGRDITKLQTTVEQLKKSNERFELLGSITQDALWEWDLVTGRLWANEVHQQLYGLTLKDPVPVAEEWKRRIHPQDAPAILEGEYQAKKNGQSHWICEYRFFTENKGWIHIYDRTFFVRDENGKVIKQLGSMLDITSLVEARRNLENEKKIYESIIDSLPGTFYLFGEDNRLIRWNRNLSEITKFSDSELAGLHAEKFFDITDREKIRGALRQVYQKGYSELEAMVCTKHNEKIPFYITGKKVSLDGKNYLLGTGIDLTHIKQTEDRLKEMERAISREKVQAQKRISRAIIQAQDKERNHLAAELHDNINQLLAGCKLYLNLVTKSHPEAKAGIEYPMELLNQTIQEIRTLSHKYVTPQKYVNLEKLLTQLLENVEKTTEIQIEQEYLLNEDALADDLKINLYRIVQEQFTNIIKHSGSKSARLSCKTTDHEIAMIIEDRGVGFNPLEKKDGVGLNNIINRVEAFNGEVTIESAHNKGTKVRLVIPLSQKCST